MKRVIRPVYIRECSEWISWFAWYPVRCTEGRHEVRVWLERVEYRYTLRSDGYHFEYRTLQKFPSRSTQIRVKRRSH